MFNISKQTKKVKVAAPNGKVAAPYSCQNDVLTKRCSAKHIWRARQAVGIDEHVWHALKDRVRLVRFAFDDGRVFEIAAEDFERQSFLHGDGINFARTLFVRIADLELVREAPPARGQLALALGV